MVNTFSVVRMDEDATRQTSTLVPNLQFQTNSLCFIDRLPTEILETIFIQCVRSYYSRAYGHPIPTPPSWVNVSYVSRYWRNVALNYPTLWSYPFVTSRRWTEELLKRSQHISLKLILDLHRTTKSSVDFVEQVTNHLERVQELRLLLGYHQYQFLSKFTSRAPRLQYLSISLEYYPEEWSPEVVPFDGDTPALRTLYLANCPVRWHSLKLSSLTVLCVTSVPVRFQQDTASFLVTLSCMHNLTRLHLRHALANATGFLSSAGFHDFHKIKLPHLFYLSIEASLPTTVALLSCVNIPSETEIFLGLDLRIESNPSRVNDFTPALCSLLTRRFAMLQGPTSSGPTIRALVITSADQVTEVMFSRSEHHCRVTISPCTFPASRSMPLRIYFIFDPSTRPSDRDRITSHICCPTALPSIQTLHAIEPPFSPVFWTHVLGRLQDLRHLKLSHGCMPDLAPLLALTSCGPTDGPADRSTDKIPTLALEKFCQILDTVGTARGSIAASRSTISL